MDSSFGSDSYVFDPDSFSDSDHQCNQVFLTFKVYALETHTPELVRILLEEERNVHYSLTITVSDFIENNVAISDNLFFDSENTLKSFDLACLSAMIDIYKRHQLQQHMSVKPYTHVRLKKLPLCSEVWRDRVPKSRDIGSFLSVDGTVIRTCGVKVLKSKAEFVCSKCKCAFTVEADFKLHHAFAAPVKCPITPGCSSQRFNAVTESRQLRRNCKDYQEIKVQEQVRKLGMGTIPRSICVILEDDLVDSCKAGDDVVVTGMVTCRWQPLANNKRSNLELVIKANNVEVCNNTQKISKGLNFDEIRDEFSCFWASYTDQPLAARNHILMSMCPQVYGLYVVKLAVALALAGGVSRVDSYGSHIRGESHLLLVGDPGTGKSQFLKYAAKIIPRSVLTTGIGSSTAGLTVSAIRDGPQWILEAGALVLSDGGVCCIDEFSGIREQDRCAIHEAMEQQSISVAKAGLVCKLNTRTTILAATNPKLGKYDSDSSISMNIGMASPLLSRFDVVLVLRDSNNASWDSVVADYLLHDDRQLGSVDEGKCWSLQQMQTYFSIIRDINPTVSKDADEVLKAYYRCHRNSSTRNAARTTIRLLESLIRLSEAHARFMFRDVVQVQDAITAITIMESSMEGGSLLPTGNILHSCFPKHPEREYQKHCRLVLELLGLESIARKHIPNYRPANDSNAASESSSSSTPKKNQHQTTTSSQQQRPPPSAGSQASSGCLFDSNEASASDIFALLRESAAEDAASSQAFAVPTQPAKRRKTTMLRNSQMRQQATRIPRATVEVENSQQQETPHQQQTSQLSTSSFSLFSQDQPSSSPKDASTPLKQNRNTTIGTPDGQQVNRRPTEMRSRLNQFQFNITQEDNNDFLLSSQTSNHQPSAPPKDASTPLDELNKIRNNRQGNVRSRQFNNILTQEEFQLDSQSNHQPHKDANTPVDGLNKARNAYMHRRQGNVRSRQFNNILTQEDQFQQPSAPPKDASTPLDHAINKNIKTADNRQGIRSRLNQFQFCLTQEQQFQLDQETTEPSTAMNMFNNIIHSDQHAFPGTVSQQSTSAETEPSTPRNNVFKNIINSGQSQNFQDQFEGGATEPSTPMNISFKNMISSDKAECFNQSQVTETEPNTPIVFKNIIRNQKSGRSFQNNSSQNNDSSSQVIPITEPNTPVNAVFKNMIGNQNNRSNFQNNSHNQIIPQANEPSTPVNVYNSGAQKDDDFDDVDHFQINNDIDWDALIDLEVSTSDKPSELTSANDSFNGQPAFDDEFCTPLPQENQVPCPTIERKKSVEESLSRSIFTLDDIDFDL